jgi:transposase
VSACVHGWGRFKTTRVARRVVSRWVVERTITWIGRYRWLSKDYEYLTESSETMIYLAMSRLLLRRLARRARMAYPVRSDRA